MLWKELRKLSRKMLWTKEKESQVIKYNPGLGLIGLQKLKNKKIKIKIKKTIKTTELKLKNNTGVYLFISDNWTLCSNWWLNRTRCSRAFLTDSLCISCYVPQGKFSVNNKSKAVRSRCRKLVWENRRRHHWFPYEMTSENRMQKFHTDDVSLPGSGKHFLLAEANFKPIRGLSIFG